MLQIKNLTIHHRRDLRTVLQDFSFALQPGDRAVIIGEEGNGKSTLLKLIHDPALVEDYAEWSGEILKDGCRTGLLFQELPRIYWPMTVYEYFAAIPDFWDQTPGELAEISRQLGFSTTFFYSDQQVGTLSGGEKVKLQMAGLLVTRPDVLLLDEPSNDLDIETLEWLEGFLLSCHLPVLYISHDEVLIQRTANLIIHLELVRRKTLPRHTVARLSYDEYLDRRQRQLEDQTRQARWEQRDWEAREQRFMRIQSSVDHQLNAISRQDPHGGRLLKKKMKAVKSMERRFEREKAEMTQLPDLEDAIMVRFPEGCSLPAGKRVLEFSLPRLEVSGRTLAESVSLTVTGPERLCIIGRNGAGKTTLLREIARQLVSRTDIRAGYMPQDYGEQLNLNLTPVEFLAPSGKKEELTRAQTFLGSVRYTPEEMAHPVSALSGGQKAKLLMMKMVLEGCNVLILDEPTRNFSPLSAPVIREVLASFPGAIISISHDRRYLKEVCTRICRLTQAGLEPFFLPDSY